MVSECPLVKNRGGTPLSRGLEAAPACRACEDIAHQASCWAGAASDDLRGVARDEARGPVRGARGKRGRGPGCGQTLHHRVGVVSPYGQSLPIGQRPWGRRLDDNRMSGADARDPARRAGARSWCPSLGFYQFVCVDSERSVVWPKLVDRGTSAASRPRPTRTRPIRGVLWRASNVYQVPER